MIENAENPQPAANPDYPQFRADAPDTRPNQAGADACKAWKQVRGPGKASALSRNRGLSRTRRPVVGWAPGKFRVFPHEKPKILQDSCKTARKLWTTCKQGAIIIPLSGNLLKIRNVSGAPDKGKPCESMGRKAWNAKTGTPVMQVRLLSHMVHFMAKC